VDAIIKVDNVQPFIAEVDQILTRHWSAVETLVNALAFRNELDTELIRDLLGMYNQTTTLGADK
jgi:hypothetical protein